MSEILDYDELVISFETGLITTLRGHGVGGEMLEMWVPDADPAKGILNMVEAAQAAGRRDIAIRVAERTLPPGRRGDLVEMLAELGTVAIAPAEGGSIVHVRDL